MTRAALLAILAALAGPEAVADPIATAALALDYDDNIANAAGGRDLVDDVSFGARAAAGWRWMLGDRSDLSAVAQLDGARQARYTGLDRLETGGTITLHTKLGLGGDAPWLKISGGGGWCDVAFAPRDVWYWRAGAALGTRFGERLDVALAFDYEGRAAGHDVDVPFLVRRFGLRGDAYDTQAKSLGLSAVYALTERLSLVAGYTRRAGDVVSTVHIDREVFEASSAITPDPTFGPGRFAYRLGADSNVYDLTFSLALGAHLALDLGYRHQDSEAYEELAYHNEMLRLALVYAY
ncbi:MAG: hypothetical protein HY749_17725 [Gammaproteobacteria bacterium]|nr:hypothetical protein [Gammaproteobacteria bacterium]MBI5615941.1 hypothetical protein [Gammaproteobacteria bacterium]